MLRSDIQPSNRPEDIERRKALLKALRRRQTYVRIAVVVLVLVLLGLLRFVAYPAFLAAPDHAHVVVTRIQNSIGQRTQQTVFDQQFTTIAPQIYAAIVDNPRIPTGGVLSCTSGYPFQRPYYHYELTFLHKGIVTGVATRDETGGCEIIKLSYPIGAPTYFSTAEPDGSSFYQRLNALTGAPLPI